MNRLWLAVAVVCSAFASRARAQTDWVYQPMNAKGVVCREGGEVGLAVRRAPADSNRIVIVMQGGGGCYDEESCTGNPKSFSLDEFTRLRGGELNMGIFYRWGSDNPFRDYHQVYIPYCSGDMHAGDTEIEVAGKLQQHRGYDNSEIYFDEIVRQFRDQLLRPGAEVMLLGQSAGGFGALFNAPRLREKLRAFSPSVRFIFANESAPPFDQSVASACFTNGWRSYFGFDATFLHDYCPSCSGSNWLASWHEYLLRHYPDMTQVFLGSTRDPVISGFLREGWPGCQETPSFSWDRYTQGLQAIRTRMQSARTRYGTPTATFFVAQAIVNAFHVFTTYPYYYSTTARNPAGQSIYLKDWLSGLYDRTPGAADDAGQP